MSSVECKQGLVVGLDLTKVEGLSSGESGFIIPNEIGILTNLQKLDLYNTGLIGSIPTKIGLLTELTSLGLCKRLFSVLIVSMLGDKQIHSLLLTCPLFFSLILFDR